MTTPTYNYNQLQSLLAAAGISVVEAARLFKVSRQTIYTWMKGVGPTQPLIASTAERIIKGIERALSANALPLVNTDDDAHFKELVLALKKYV